VARGKASVNFMGGHNSKRDPGMVGFSQLIRSQGAMYRASDPEMIHRIEGRSLVGDVGSVQKVKGLGLADFKDGTEFLLAFGGDNKIYYGDISNGTTCTFTAVTDPDSGTREATDERMSMAYYNDDRWYICTGDERNVVIDSEATIVQHGMDAPLRQRLDIGTLSGGVQARVRPSTATTTISTSYNIDGSPDVEITNWFRITQSYDGVFEGNFWGYKQFGGCALTEEDDFAQVDYEFTNTATMNNKTLGVWFWTGDTEFEHDSQWPPDDSDAAAKQREWKTYLNIKVSENGGTTYSSELTQFKIKNHNGIQLLLVPLENAVNVEDVRVRIRFEIRKKKKKPAFLNLRVYEVSLFNDALSTVTTNNNIWYAYSEYDETRDWESALSAPIMLPAAQACGGVELSNFPAKRNANTTHYRVYRTSDNNTSYVKSELGFVGQMLTTRTAQSNGKFRDTFDQVTPAQSPLPSYEFLQIDAFGTKGFYDLNVTPPPMSWIGNYKGVLYGLSENAYVQAMPGNPSQWPTIFQIDRFPFSSNSPLKCGFQVGDSLWIGAQDGCVMLDSPIRVRSGSLHIPEPRRLEGAPGVTGEYAATPLTANGEPLIAWVSNHGVYVSNLATYQRITDDIDWEDNLTEAQLSKAVLHWDEKDERLVLIYDSNADGVNDKFALIHMNPSLARQDTGMPMITWDHDGDFSCLTGGKVGGVYKRFTGHDQSAGKGNEVYLEGGSKVADASQSADGATDDIVFDVQTGREYSANDVDISDASIYCTVQDRYRSLGASVTLSIGYTTGREDGPTDRTVTFTTTFANGTGNRGQWIDFNVAEAGEFAQWRVRHVGQSQFTVGRIEMDIEGTDEGRGDIE
jgi:hypothetical protein